MEGKLALRTVQNADLTWTASGCPRPTGCANANWFKDTNTVLRHTRGGVAWSSVGAMMAVYEVAVQYAQDREQFGRPIGGFQLVQDLLARMLGNITASLALAVRVAQLQDDGVFRDEQGALAKSYCTSRLRETVGVGPRAARRQRHPARLRRRPVLQRRRGAVLVRGHPRDQHADRRPVDHRDQRVHLIGQASALRISCSRASSTSRLRWARVTVREM